MNKTTARGVYYDIKDSLYSLTVDEFTFYFSSLYYLRKFDEQHNTKDLFFLRSIRNLDLYSKVEKRGARVLYKGVEYHCVKTLLSEFVSGIEKKLQGSINPSLTKKAD